MFSFFRRRDSVAFPADDYGDELYRVMQKNSGGEERVGVELAFNFSAEADARSFLYYVDHANYTADLEAPDAPGEPFTVETMREIEPRYTAVRVLIEQMRASARAHNGMLSAWHLFW